MELTKSLTDKGKVDKFVRKTLTREFGFVPDCQVSLSIDYWRLKSRYKNWLEKNCEFKFNMIATGILFENQNDGVKFVLTWSGVND